MVKIREYRTARVALEAAIARLQSCARNYTQGTEDFRTRELLAAGREYGRALARVEKMRPRKKKAKTNG